MPSLFAASRNLETDVGQQQLIQGKPNAKTIQAKKLSMLYHLVKTLTCQEMVFHV